MRAVNEMRCPTCGSDVRLLGLPTDPDGECTNPWHFPWVATPQPPIPMHARQFWNEYCLTEDGETSDWPLFERMLRFAEAYARHEIAALRGSYDNWR
jgi:hypothetical protein